MKKLLLAVCATCLALFFVNAFLSLIHFEYIFNQLVFSDSFKADKRDRLFFPDKDRIFALANQPPNSNMYPEFTDRETWNVDLFGWRPDYRPNDQRDATTSIIVMLGDSFVYGEQMSHFDSYPSQTEKFLLNLGFDVNIINAGVPGYGPDQQFLALRQVLEEVEPDIIIWNIYSNDLTDTNYYCLFQPENTQDGQVLRQLSVWRNNVYRQGFIVDLLPWRVSTMPIVHLITHFIGRPYGGDGELPISTWGCTQPLSSKLLLDLKEKVNLILEQAEQEADRAGAEIVFVILPVQSYFSTRSEHTLDTHYLSILERMPVLEGKFVLNFNKILEERYVINAIAENVSSHDVLIQPVDVFTDFYFSEIEEPDTFPRHLNAQGNKVISDVVGEYLLNHFFMVSSEGGV